MDVSPKLYAFDQTLTTNLTNYPQSQPWRAFLAEPVVKPFIVDGNGGNSILRLKSEKDEHGLGG
jgi:hypothetical protein